MAERCRIDHRFRVIDLSPNLHKTGTAIGDRIGANRVVPWPVAERYLRAFEEVLDTRAEVAYVEPFGHPGSIVQIRPVLGGAQAVIVPLGDRLAMPRGTRRGG